MGWFHDNLIAYKLQYFLNFGGLGSASPFLHVLGRQLGFSQVTIGWVFASAPFLDMLCKPLICSWADRRQAARLVFLVLLSVSAVALTSFVFVPPLSVDANITQSNASSGGDTSDPGGGVEDLRHYQFWLYALLVLVAWIGVSTNQTMADGMTARVVETLGADYGRQRLWGTIGLGAMSTVSGYLIERTSSGDTTNYSIGFYVAGVFMALDVLLSSFFFKIPPEEHKPTSWTEMMAALRHWPVVCFAACCTAIGICTGLLWSFHIWYLEDVSQAAGYPRSRVQLLEGLTLLVKALACQIPLMFMSGAVLKRLGHKTALTFSMGSLGLYCVLYSQLTDPWYCLLMEPLSGVAFGLLYPAIASYARSIAPPGTVVTTQAIMAASFDGLGVGVGTLLSAYIFSRYGGSVTFLSFGVAALIVAMLYWSVSSLAERFAAQGTEPDIVFDNARAIGPAPSQVGLISKDQEEEEEEEQEQEEKGYGSMSSSRSSSRSFPAAVPPREEDPSFPVVVFTGGSPSGEDPS